MPRIRIPRLYIEKLIIMRLSVETKMKTNTAKHLETLYENITKEIHALSKMQQDAELDYVEIVTPKPYKNYILT